MSQPGGLPFPKTSPAPDPLPVRSSPEPSINDVIELFLSPSNIKFLSQQLPYYPPDLVKKWARRWPELYYYNDNRLLKPSYSTWGFGGTERGARYDITKDLAGLNHKFIHQHKKNTKPKSSWEDKLTVSQFGSWPTQKPNLSPIENWANGKLWRHLRRSHRDQLSHKDPFESEATEFEHVLYKQQEPNKTTAWLDKYGQPSFVSAKEIYAKCRRNTNPP